MGWCLGRRCIEEINLVDPESRVGELKIGVPFYVSGSKECSKGEQVQCMEDPSILGSKHESGARFNLCFNYPSMLLLMTHHKFEEAETLTVQHMDRH